MSQDASPSQLEQAGAPSTQNNRLVTETELFASASIAKLPVPIKSDVASWVVLAQTIAVTSSLFAAVQISLNTIVESAIFASDPPKLGGRSLETWRFLRWFLYSTVIVNLGCAGTAVAVINMAASLECDIGYMATRYHRLVKAPSRSSGQGTNTSTREGRDAKRYEAVYAWVTTGALPENFFDHRVNIRRLEDFGIGKSFGWISWSMTVTFIAGGAFIFLTFLYWVILTQTKAAVALMAVVVALALGLTLSFLLY